MAANPIVAGASRRGVFMAKPMTLLQKANKSSGGGGFRNRDPARFDAQTPPQWARTPPDRAAQALRRGATVVTHNTREFSRVPGLKCEDWQSR